MEQKKRILLIKGDSSGCFPIPAVKGGAVQTLIEQIIAENEKESLLSIDVISFYDKYAAQIAERKYTHTKFIWIHISQFVKSLDKVVFIITSKIWSVKKAKSIKSLFSGITFIRKSSYFLKKNNYDAVILENYIPLAWIIRLSGYTGRYYFHIHNIPTTNAKCKKVFDNCNGYLCVSGYVAQKLEEGMCAIGNVPSSKLYVVLNGIDTNSIKDEVDHKIIESLKNKYAIDETKKIVLFVGRLCKEKGVDYLLEALRVLNDENIVAVIVGGVNYTNNYRDPFTEELKKLSEGLQVVFTGYVPYKEISNYYGMADVIVLPSVWEEPCGLSIGEAIASGKPVISTKDGGIPEISDGCAMLVDVNGEIVSNLAKTIEVVLHEKVVSPADKIEKYRQVHSLENYYHNFVETINRLTRE